jgi:glycosyltransferase involved in cell wall biosynthesis
MALNRGIAEARGRLIARMDADDISLPDRLATQVKMFQNDGEFAIIGSAVQIVSQKKSRSAYAKDEIREEPARIITHPTHPILVHWSMFFFCSLAHPTVMTQSALFKRFSYNDEFPHCEDYALWAHCLSQLQQSRTAKVDRIYRQLLAALLLIVHSPCYSFSRPFE